MKQIKDTKLLRNIAVVLKELRNLKGKTQDEVFNKTNIHVARVEAANTNLTVSTLSALCNYYTITLSDFHSRVEQIQQVRKRT